MKKKGLLFTCLLVVLTMALLLCGCGSTYGKILSAFEKAGWEEVQEVSQTQKDAVKALFGDDYESICKVHVLKKTPKEGSGIIGGAIDALSFATVVEFNSNKDMEEALKDKVSAEDAKNIYDELQKLDNVNGNCFMVGTNGYDIFKSTK